MDELKKERKARTDTHGKRKSKMQEMKGQKNGKTMIKHIHSKYLPKVSEGGEAYYQTTLMRC